jgi:hypothetical protein
LSKLCLACDPAVPNNGGAVVREKLRFIFAATCTLDYFLQFIRYAFLNHHHFRTFLLSMAEEKDAVSTTLLEMEHPLLGLDWNMARFIWLNLVGVIDHTVNKQHRSETTFAGLKVRSNKLKCL